MSETTNAQEEKSTITPADFHMPPNSYWPIILAFGFVLVLTGLAISWPISIAGVRTGLSYIVANNGRLSE